MNPEDDQQAPSAPLIEHLLELRDRLLKVVGLVLLITAALLMFANDIYGFVAKPLMQYLPEGTSMIATEVASPFLTPFKLTLVTAVVLSMPVILYHMWAFIAPGLYRQEKRLMLPLLVSSILLFYAGMAFAYYVVFPLVFGFFTSVGPENVAVMTDISSYLNFVLKLFFAFGIAFEIPIATVIFIALGVITPQTLAAKRPYVVVGCFVLGMLLTPPDIISQALLAIPMWLLFEVGILIGKLFYLPRKEQSSTSDS